VGFQHTEVRNKVEKRQKRLRNVTKSGGDGHFVSEKIGVGSITPKKEERYTGAGRITPKKEERYTGAGRITRTRDERYTGVGHITPTRKERYKGAGRITPMRERSEEEPAVAIATLG